MKEIQEPIGLLLAAPKQLHIYNKFLRKSTSLPIHCIAIPGDEAKLLPSLVGQAVLGVIVLGVQTEHLALKLKAVNPKIKLLGLGKVLSEIYAEYYDTVIEHGRGNLEDLQASLKEYEL